jgi:hypothetical protein
MREHADERYRFHQVARRSVCAGPPWIPRSPTNYDLLFFFGILAPDFRASLSAIATACLRLFTFLRPPDFNVPSLYSCITFSVLARPFAAGDDRFLDVFFVAIGSL